MGSSATCTQCDFSFTGGHSHHEGGAMCMCAACLAEYFLPTSSPWGPSVGEVLELCRQEMRRGGNGGKRQPVFIVTEATGTTVRVVQGEAYELGGRTAYLAHYELEHAACPGCGETALVMGFEPEAACPKCKSGKLAVHFVEF